MDEAQALTYGQQVVGLTFNPSGDEAVNKVKQLYADVIDLLNSLRTPDDGTYGDARKNHILTLAEDQALVAQMLAVKAITWKF